MTTSSANNSVFRGFFEKQKLTGPNFIDWYRQLRIVLSIKDKLNYLEQPLPPVPVAPEGQQVAPEIIAAHTAWIKGSKEIAGLMLMTMEPEIQRNLENLHANDMLKELKTLFAQQAEHELLQTMRDFHSCKQEEGQSVSSYVLKMKSYIDNLEHLGHPVTLGLDVSLILIGLQNYNMHSLGKTFNELHAMLKLHEQTLTLPKNNAPALILTAPRTTSCSLLLLAAELLKKKKNAASGAGGSGIFTIELNTFLNRSWIYDTGCGTHICNTTQGLRASRKLKPGALSLYVGNGQREAVEAIGIFYLCLPSGLEIVLNNCHYAPSITRGVISVSRLYEDGFINRFVNNTIQVSRNNMVYFSAIPRDGIFEIDLSNSYANESSIYTVSNKRAKLDLDSALLWHCHLGHISKKRIKKLQHDGLLNSTHLKAFEKYVPCMSGKMARKPYTHQVKRAKDLLGLIHTDVCGPFKIMSRQGANYFVTFTDDFSRYGYVYLLKHKCEVFETFKVFQKEVENQFGKTIKSQRSDRGGEYMSQEFLDNLKDHGIIAHRTPPYTPQHNSVLERRNRTLLDMVRSMMSQTTLPKSFWDYSLETAARILNLVPTKKALVKKDTLTKPDNSEPRSTRTQRSTDQMQSMKDNEVWDLVELPPNGKTVGRKWLFKKKTDMDGAVHTYKAHIRAIRILIAIAAFYDYEIWQIDVKTAFRNGYLSEEVYMEQPEGFVNPKYPNRNITSRFQQNPGDLHWTTVKNIMKYLRNTKDMFLVYEDADDLKSQIGYVFVLNGGAIDWKSAKQSIFATFICKIDEYIAAFEASKESVWKSAKQSIFATSSAEAEYIAAYDASKEAVWVRKFISGLGVVPIIEEPISMYCDNTGAITIANESGITKGARHFRAKVHYLREVIEFGDIKLEKVHTDDNLADPFTKALAFPKHSEHTKNIGMLLASSLM
ncbi:retrotransposon protein, putative, ty1-copia subclass [Tanacetum coccineum]